MQLSSRVALLSALAFLPAFGLVNFGEPAPYAVVGTPFSGNVRMDEATQLPGGVTLMHKVRIWRVFRDSQGRTRDESGLSLDFGVLHQSFEITDPVAGYVYKVDAKRPMAERRKLAPVRSVRPSEFTPASYTEETSLGVKSMLGYSVNGSRRPSPTRGVVTESWWSSDLDVVLASKTTGAGPESETLVTNIVRAEPDAALFQIPAGYTIVDR
jgi:hypothetical protein